MPLISIFRCPTCSLVTKIDIGFADVLGPPVVICKRCQNKIHTNLREWTSLSTRSRIEYILVSALAMIFGSYFMAGGIYVAWTFQSFSNAAWHDSRFLALYIGIGFLTAVIKILFVLMSLKRTKNNGELVKASLATWHMNFGLYYTMVVIFLVILAYYSVAKPATKP